MSSVVKLDPAKIVYISCGPETLARDLEYFTKHGYDVKKIQPVDMFSFTDHCEVVCLLGKRKPDDKVRISIDMDDYYRIREKAESK